MAKKRKPKIRKSTKSHLLCVHIPPNERAEMIKYIPNHNWSEIASKAFRDAVAEMKRLREMKSQE